MCGCMSLLGEKEDCLNERVQAHTFIQTPGEAESVECRGMSFLDWSLLLLLTGEFCTLHSEHNTWFTLSHQRKHCMLSLIHTLTFSLYRAKGFLSNVST